MFFRSDFIGLLDNFKNSLLLQTALFMCFSSIVMNISQTIPRNGLMWILFPSAPAMTPMNGGDVTIENSPIFDRLFKKNYSLICGHASNCDLNLIRVIFFDCIYVSTLYE